MVQIVSAVTVVTLVTGPATFSISGVPRTGLVSQYAPGVIERVVQTRQAWGQLPANLPEVAGFIAVPECSDIGRLFLLRLNGEWGLFLAADCGSKTDGGYQWMLDNNVLVEVDYRTAERFGFAGRVVTGELLRTTLEIDRLLPAVEVSFRLL